MKNSIPLGFIRIFILLICLTSCGSKKQQKVALPADFKGGSTKRGVDCSGFVSIVYREVYGKQLARSSADMLKYNCKKVSRAKLQEGDLVFFKTGRGGKRGVPNHVGIYLKNGRFIHTSTSSGVMVSSLSEPYYTRTWLTGGRVK